MSLLSRVITLQPGSARRAQSPAPGSAPAPVTALRRAFPNGPFASLETDPPAAADAAYAAFMRHDLTPGVAERAVAEALADADVSCPAFESTETYRYELERERSYTGRRRVFVRYLVRLQYIHEANMRTLRALRRDPAVRRVTVLPGCCSVCDARANRPHRLAQPPELPVPGCQRHGGCICGYVPVIE